MRFHSGMLTAVAALILMGCPSKSKRELHPSEDEKGTDGTSESSGSVGSQNLYFSVPEESPSEPAAHADFHPRDTFDWSKAIHDPGEERPKYTRSMQKKTQLIHGAVVKKLGGSSSASDLLNLISLREISHHGSQRPFDGRGIVHRLSADKEGALESWYKASGRYAKENPLYKNSKIWMSYGPQGMNSPLFLHIWDVEGDPRMLGDTVIADLTYLRAARGNLRKLNSSKGIRCWDYDQEGQYQERYNSKTGEIRQVLRAKVRRDEVGKVVMRNVPPCGPDSFMDIDGDGRDEIVHRDEHGRVVAGPDYTCIAPTWEFVHRATSGGKVCPPWSKDAGALWYMGQFRRRAERIGLDPYELVADRDLGSEPTEDQYQLWMSIWDSVLESLDEEPMDWTSEELVPDQVN